MLGPVMRRQAVNIRVGLRLCPLRKHVILRLNPTLQGARCHFSVAVSASTSATKPGVKPERSSKYALLEERDVSFFRSVVGETNVITDESELKAFNTDWMHKYHGQSRIAVRPRSTEEVSKILSYCNQRKLAVVPQGGNTGLVGGSVPVHDEVILLMGNMNKILDFDPHLGVVTAEAGVVLETLNNFLAERGFMMPLDLGAKGSCQIGGNLSTNAGGIRFVRYGSLRGNVLGLEAVLANGTVVDCMSTLRKDNTGYDLKQLFIGSEGTLGVITKVAIFTPKKPKSVHVAWLGIDSFQEVLQTMAKAKEDLGEIISAIEFIDSECLDLAINYLPGVRDPLESKHPFYMLIETSGSDEQHNLEKLERFLESAMESGLVKDGTVAQDEAQAKSLWRLREGQAEALSRAGAVYKYDISLPLSVMYDVVEDIRKRVQGKGARVVGYGHLGDSNLHLNVSAPQYSDELLNLIEPYIFEQTAKYRGSVSAEHGLGLNKAQYIHLSKSKAAIDLMYMLKRQFDPNGILNPYKVLPYVPGL